MEESNAKLKALNKSWKLRPIAILFVKKSLVINYLFFLHAFAIFSLLAAQRFSIITIVTLEWTHLISYQ